MKAALAALSLACAVAFPSAAANDLPSRPMRIVVPSSVGGGTDLLARLVAERLARRIGMAVIVENMPGGENSLAMHAIAVAAKDGSTLGLATPLFATASEHSYDPVKDFVPVAMIGSSPLVLAVNPSIAASDLQDFIELARGKPGMMNYASLGSTTTQGLAAGLFNRMAGIEAVEIPYKGSALGVMDLLAGNVQYIFNGLPSMLPYIAAGKLRALGVTSAARAPQLPDVPAIGETLKGYEVSTWYALVAPAGTPAAVVKRLNREVVAIMDDPQLHERLRSQGIQTHAMKPDELARFFDAECRRWSKAAREARAAAR